MESIRMKPVMKETVWGGRLLADRFNKEIPSAHTGEAWEIASHPHGESTAADGVFQGTTLGELVRTHKEELVGSAVYARYGTFFPLLVKFIDAEQNLSVQVHPNDAQAVRLEGEGSSGKTEMWYVLDARPGARLVYGLKRTLSRDEFAGAIRNGTVEKELNWIPVSAGDAFLIPAGTLHAIGGGLLIAEIQQNADLTYRIYDYGRMGLDGKPRLLHIEKGVQVTNLHAMADRPGTDIDRGVRCDYFETFRIYCQGRTVLPIDPKRFEILICVNGEGTLDRKPCRAGDTFLIPASAGQTELEGAMVLLQTHVK